MPDNTQTDQILFYLSQSPIDMSRLSPDGQKFVANYRGIVETARLLVKEKNAGELLQNFLWHTGLNKAAVDTEGATRNDNIHTKNNSQEGESVPHDR